MKRCPTCNRTFTDANLSFCIEDGTPLIQVNEYDPEATIVSSSPGAGGQPPPPNQGTAPTDWRGPAYQPPIQYPPPPPAPQRKAWPWVVGVLAVLLLAVIGVGIAAAILLPDLIKARQARNDNSLTPPTNSRPAENSNRNSNADANSNANTANLNSNGNDNTNSNANTDTNAPPPTDEELVLSDLKNIEDEWTAANLNADKKKLGRILADDYVGTTAEGQMQGKADYLKDIKPDPSVKHWEFQALKLTLKGDRVTLSGIVKLEGDEDAELLLRFTDKFVWRDGRWQAVGSEVTQIK
jgi:Domain of unknown function (DUF4440)